MDMPGDSDGILGGLGELDDADIDIGDLFGIDGGGMGIGRFESCRFVGLSFDQNKTLI